MECVDRARGAWPRYALLPLCERAHVLRRMRREVLRRGDEIAQLVTQETGKPELEAFAHEVLVVAALLRYYERLMPRLLRPRRTDPGLLLHKRAYVTYEPLGVAAVISPWNYPFSLVGIPAVCALSAGNAIVVKPSEVTPRSGALFVEIARNALRAAGCEEAAQVLQGGGEAGAALVDAPPDIIAFVGSERTGTRIATAAAAHLTPCILELGANDAAIVCADADLERAARGVVWGAFSNCGQACVSIERAFVERTVYARFCELVVKETRALRRAIPPTRESDIGRMTFPPQVPIARRALADAVERGARVLCGGGGEGLALEPTVLADVPLDAVLHVSETFGPLLPLCPVESAEEGVALANRGPYGLNATVWTRDRRRARRLARLLESGSITVDDALVNLSVSSLPYGGVKHSGYGRLMGEEGLRAFTRTKSILEPRLRLPREPVWFPYAKRGPLVRGLLRRLLSR
ncbi:aldehyde dehydrogenase family protein [bacterium]|nr:MAG: aldehyde dehydrogenase family protein [bacterium]